MCSSPDETATACAELALHDLACLLPDCEDPATELDFATKKSE